MTLVHQSPILRRVRDSLLRRIEAIRPEGVRQLPRHARKQLIIQTVRADAHSLLQPQPLSPAEVASRLARLSVLYAESPENWLPQLSEFPRVLAHLASKARASHIPTLLLSLLLVSVGCVEKDAEARFNSVFSILMCTWPPCSSWHPADYVAITDAVSVALLLRFPPSRARRVPQTLTELFITRAPPLRLTPDLTALAFAIATISSFKLSRSSHPVCVFFVRELSLCHNLCLPILRQNTLTALTVQHTTPVAVVMLVSTTGLDTLTALPPLLQRTLISSLETILLNMELHVNCPNPDEFNVNLHNLLSSRMENIGASYGAVSTMARRTGSSVDFVARLVTSRVLVSPLTPFVSTFVANVAPHVTPQAAVTLVDIFSYLSKLPSSVVLVIASTIAKEICGVTSLLGLLTATLSDAQKSNAPVVAQKIYDRASKLERLTAVTLMIQERNKNVTGEGWLENIDDSVFEPSIQVIVKSVVNATPGSGLSSIVRSGLELISAFVRNKGVYLRQARRWAIVSGVPVIFRNFLGDQSSWSPTSTLVQIIARLFDSVADGTSERELVKSCLDDIVPLAVGGDSQHFDKVENNERSRIVYILLLRFMTRCDLAVIDLAMDAVDLSLGPSGVRKQSLLRPAQIAVLGSELGRKDICVDWLLRTFNNLGSSSYVNQPIEGGHKSSMRAVSKL